MPIYVYACQACSGEIERRQSFSDSALTTCETCGGALRRVLQPSGVIFKGSGFYNTDYKNASGNGKPKSEESAEKSKEGGSQDGPVKEGASKDATSKDGSAAGSKTGDSASTGAKIETASSSSTGGEASKTASSSASKR